MNKYQIIIKETLEMTVSIEANSISEAEIIARDNYFNEEYVLSDENFIEVEFFPEI